MQTWSTLHAASFPREIKKTSLGICKLGSRPAPGVGQVSCSLGQQNSCDPASCFVYARAVEKQVGCCECSCRHPENVIPGVMSTAGVEKLLQQFCSQQYATYPLRYASSNSFPIATEAPSLVPLLWGRNIVFCICCERCWADSALQDWGLHVYQKCPLIIKIVLPCSPLW